MICFPGLGNGVFEMTADFWKCLGEVDYAYTKFMSVELQASTRSA